MQSAKSYGRTTYHGLKYAAELSWTVGIGIRTDEKFICVRLAAYMYYIYAINFKQVLLIST